MHSLKAGQTNQGKYSKILSVLYPILFLYLTLCISGCSLSSKGAYLFPKNLLSIFIGKIGSIFPSKTNILSIF